ncbi:unnamed protein product, partial [marine sediment metagenome]
MCQKESYLNELVRYIHLNPVRAGLSDNPVKWQWSSYNTYFGEKNPILMDTETVLNSFSNDIGEANKKFAEFICDGINSEIDKDLYPHGKLSVLGNTSFLKYINNNIDELRRKTRSNFRIGLDELISEISKKNNLKIIDLKSMGGERAVSRARAVFSYIAHIYCGYKTTD